MASIFDRMINPATGQIEWFILAEAAETRASDYKRGPRLTERELCDAEAWCIERAQVMQRCWYRDRGLPVPGEEASVMVSVPDWGASGDSFGRR